MEKQTTRLAPQQESGDLSPILIGDYIVLQDLTVQSPGFVSGDAALERCGVQRLPAGNRSPQQYDDYVFQIFPSLIYRSRMEQLARTKSRSVRSRASSTRSSSIRRASSISSTEMNERENEEKLLHDRIEHEDKLNNNTMHEVRLGIRKEAIRYGQTIQLLHVKSNLFITCHHSAALKDASCRKVSLRDGALSAQFQVLPCFKAQTEGSVVFSTHSIKLASVRLNGNMFLHTSEKVYEDVFKEDSKTLPSCLRIQQTMELNASSKFTTFVIRKCSSFKKGIGNCLQASFSPFRLYHSQAESFITASSNSDKNERNRTRKAKFKSADSENLLTLPPHIPYLRAVDQYTAGEDPDPTDPRNHTSKSVWVLEPVKMYPLNKNSSGAVGWGDAVHIRHLPSGRYLCVDTSAPFHTLPPSERWFRTYLVYEPTDDPELLRDSANYCAKDEAVFRMECEGTPGDCIPKNVSSCRVEFKLESRGSFLTLYLHNADVPKPKEGKPTLTSRMIVFSTMRSAQDTLKIMPISRRESHLTFKAKSFIPLMMAYAERVADVKNSIPSIDKLHDIVSVLIKIISFQSKANSQDKEGIDWIKKANSMLPSAFSALFEGETSDMAQRICRDIKLLDAVFMASLAPYQRLANPFNGKDKESMMGCAGIQKLVHVALQRMSAKNTASQLYFRRTLPPVRPLLRGTEETQSSWMELIKLQLEDPLGSAVSLSKLLSANGTLLRTYATPSMVQEFARMIRELGPQPRLVNFFESICAIDNMPVKANQEMILRICWRVPTDRSKLFVEVQSVRMDKPKEYGDITRLPGGDFIDKKKAATPSKPEVVPSAYYGQEEYEAGLQPVFVHWSGHDQWTQGMDDYLFFSPAAMSGEKGLETKPYGGKSMVRIEDFCWVLEPERLCHAVTGIRWSAFDSKRSSSVDVANRFHRQEQLVQYFIAEMDMLAKLCFGRSYNAITHLQSSFPYCTMISIVKNQHLPCMVRAAALNLLRVVYVDRFPQMLNCARPSIPEVLWVYDASEMPKEDIVATPVIQPINLKTGKNVKFAFPCFQISRAHKFHDDPDPLYSFPDENKFYLLATTLNDIMKSFGSGRIDHSNRSMNTLATATVKTLSDLLSFGFLSSYDKMKLLVRSLVRLLDGRRDVMYVQFDETGYEPYEEAFFPPKQRFELSTNSVSVTAVKKVALDVLLAVSDFRCQFRLGKLLQLFKDYTEDKRHVKELKVFHTYMAKFEEKSYDGFLTSQLYTQFEDLFTAGDGKLLDFEEMSKQPLNTILLDCLMYKDDVLHAKALKLLDRTFTQRYQLIKALQDVILLNRAPYYPQLNSDINYFVLLLRSTEVWAVSSKIAGPFDEKKEIDFHDMCEAIDKYLFVKVAAKYANRKSMIDSLIVGASAAASAAVGHSFNQAPGRGSTPTRRSSKVNSPARRSSNSRHSPTNARTSRSLEESEERKKAPIPEHQDMLRAMNLQYALMMALTIDYNLAFKGSICSPADKIKSRYIHIESLRKVVMIIIDFVKNNTKNQDIIYDTALPYLRQHLGDLKLPPLDDDFPRDSKTMSQLMTQPGLNTEEVIIECLRGNGRLCEEMPTSLFDDFGSLLNDQFDGSDSPLLEFFHITILPDASLNPLSRNQEATLDQLVSSKYPNTSACVFGCFNIHGQPTPQKPENIIDLLSKCIIGENSLTAARLQGLGITVDATFDVLVMKVNSSVWNELDLDDSRPISPKETKSSRWSREEEFLKDDYFIALVKFLDLQISSLVVDPRMYHRPEMWRVVSVGVGTLISAFATQLHKCIGGAPPAALVKLCGIILPCVRIVHLFFKGATQMGMDDLLGRFGERLRGDPAENANSVFASLLRIRSFLDHNDKAKKKNFPKELVAIEHKINISCRNLQFLLHPDSHHDMELNEMAVEEVADDDSLEMTPLPKRRSPSIDNVVPSKSTSTEDSPEVLLSYFVEAIKGNAKINKKLLARKFEFLNVLESIEVRTMAKSDIRDESFAKPPKDSTIEPAKVGHFLGSVLEHALDHRVHSAGEHEEPEYGVRITWNMVVERLVEFARSHNFDKNEDALIRVHNVWRNHILKARSNETTSHVLDSSEMSFNDVEQFREVQNKLDKAGVTEVALLAISTHTPGARDTAAVSAIELLRELLFSGNNQVQKSVLYYIEHVDKDARFLKHMRARLQESAHYIKERCDQVRSGYAPMQREHQLEYEEADQTLKLLTEMLEGHNYAVQNIIRSQPMQAADVDLIKMVFDLLHLQVGQPHLLKRMGEPSVNLLTSTLVFIVESLQGPCDGNQEALAKSETTIAAVKNILQSSFHPRIPRHEVMKVKCRAILIFAACLEGRKDRKVHDILVSHIDPFILQQFALEATEFIKDTTTGSTEWNKDHEMKKQVINEALQGLVALANTRTELNLVGSFAAETAEMDAKKGRVAAERMLRQAVASVEVNWNGRIEFVSFPLPKETAFLSSTTKAEFLETVDLSTHEKRMKELIRAEPNLTAEMQQVYALAKRSATYRFMHKHFSTFKLIQYALVVLLNLNVMMTEYGDDSESQDGAKKNLGYSSAFDAALYGGMQKKYRVSLAFTFILGIPNIIGYFLMMAYMGVSNIPIVIRLLDSLANEKRLEAASGQDVTFRNPSAFTSWGVTLVFNIMFIVLHMAAYPDSRQPTLYAVLILGIMPWTLICLRNYIVVPNSRETRLFCIVFDSLLTKSFFRNQLLLVFCSINGFRHSPYFTFMLLDVVNISPTIQSLVKSIMKPAPQLGIVAYLFVIIVIIFASFGLEYFEPFFMYDEEYDDDADDIEGPNPYGCHSVVACAWLIMYKGLPEGRMDQVLDFITNRDEQFLARVFFDLSFFIIVGVFLFNIITGLIVDTFGSLREEAAARADQLDNECYVCGFTRTAYDDIGMTSPSFDQHKLRNHYIWNYLYFVQYILAKDQTDYSGVESYVHGMLQSKCQDWLPARTSFATQNHGIFNDKEDSSKQREKRITSQMEHSFEAVDKRFSDMSAQVERMGERFGSEMESFQASMEQMIVKALKGSKI